MEEQEVKGRKAAIEQEKLELASTSEREQAAEHSSLPQPTETSHTCVPSAYQRLSMAVSTSPMQQLASARFQHLKERLVSIT